MKNFFPQMREMTTEPLPPQNKWEKSPVKYQVGLLVGLFIIGFAFPGASFVAALLLWDGWKKKKALESPAFPAEKPEVLPEKSAQIFQIGKRKKVSRTRELFSDDESSQFRC